MPAMFTACPAGYLCSVMHPDICRRLSRQGNALIWELRSQNAQHLDPQPKRTASEARATLAFNRLFEPLVLDRQSKRQRGPDLEDMVWGERTFEEGLMCQAATVTPPVEFTESEDE